MDAKRREREARKQELLRELAELKIEELAESGEFDATPHFGRLERMGHELGRELGRTVHERASREVVATGARQAACPTCGAVCDVGTERRTIESIDGSIEITEGIAACRVCRRSFFPSAERDGT